MVALFRKCCFIVVTVFYVTLSVITATDVQIDNTSSKSYSDLYLLAAPSEGEQPLLSAKELQSWEFQSIKILKYHPHQNFESLRDYRLNHLYSGYNSPFICYKFPLSEFTAAG